MKIVLAPYGTRGDVQPLVALGLCLQRRGHDVLLAGPLNFRAFVESHDLAFGDAGPDIGAEMRTMGDRAASMMTQVRYLRDLIPIQFRELLRVSVGTDLIIGAGIQLAGRSVAEVSGCQYAFASYAPVALPSTYHPPPVIHRQHWPRWTNRILWTGFDLITRVMVGRPLNAARVDSGLAPTGSLRTHLLPDLTLLAADPELAGLPPDLPPQVHPVPAFVLKTDERIPPSLQSFLAAGTAPILVGFGSMVASDAKDVLGAFVRASKESGVRLVLQTGWTGIEERALDVPPSCIVVRATPHGALLPRLAGIVHHGGAGTTTAAARAGIPQMIVPHLLDQYFWGTRVHRLGLGPKPVSVRAIGGRTGRVAALLTDLASRDTYRHAAGALRDRIGREDGNEAAVDLIERRFGAAGGSDRRSDDAAERVDLPSAQGA